MDCSYQGNAILKIVPETPQTTNAIKIKKGIISSDSQSLIIALQARAVSLHRRSRGVSAGPRWSHREVDISSDPVLNPPRLFLSWCDTVRQLFVSLL